MKKVLIIGPFPDPISGVSIANKVVKELLSADSDFLVETINTSYPSFDEQIGKFSIKKFLFYLSLNLSFFKIFKNNIVYITPGQTFFWSIKIFPIHFNYIVIKERIDYSCSWKLLRKRVPIFERV